MKHFESLLLVLLFSSLGFANDLSDVQVSEDRYEVTQQTIAVDLIDLGTDTGGSTQHFVQNGGDVQTSQLLVDNGVVHINGGEFNADRIAMGDPTTQRVRVTNFGWNVSLSADEPVAIQRLDFQSREGLLGMIPESELNLRDFPFQTITETANRVTFFSDTPVTTSQLELPLSYAGFDSNDLTVTLGDETNRTLMSEFEQNGGLVNVTGNLELCVPAGFGMTVVDTTVGGYEEMRYTLADGELNVGGDFVVGSIGVAPTIFEQHDGNSAIDGTFRVDGENSRATFHGGTATIGRLNVGPGTLEIGRDASLYITDAFRVGGSGEFSETSKGTTIDFATGADFSVEFWEEPFLVPGLNGLNLSFEGGSDSVSELEVFHLDDGPDSEWVADFSLGDLHIGSNGEPAQVQLVDRIGNNWANINSIYVETLTLSPGSILDLNRLNLYYDELVLGEGAEIINPGANCGNFEIWEASDLLCADGESIAHLLGELGTPAGDLNLDGVVDFPDFLILSENYGEQGVGYQGGDIDLDGTVAFPDFLQLSANWGETGNVWVVAEAAAVPEPSSSGLLLVAFVSFLACVRRNRCRHDR